MLKRIFFITAFIAFANTSSYAADEHNLYRTLKEVNPENILVYEFSIVPWIQNEFVRRAWAQEGTFVRRGLVRSDLIRFEKIEGQDRYNVHIEYNVFIRDISGVEFKGLKGQEIVFWIKNGRVQDFFPFNEYWIKGAVLQESDFY